MSKVSTYVASSFVWGTSAKIIDAAVRFVGVSLLLSYFGKENFGLISLATSINAYLQLLDLGVNTGAIKYYSQWIGEKRFDFLDKMARTGISFYGIIGIVNAAVLLCMMLFGTSVFDLTAEQAPIMKQMLLILSLSSVFNWIGSVFNQLLIANERINYIQRITIVRSLGNLVVILSTISLQLPIVWYFFWFTVVNSLQFIPLYRKCKSLQLITSLRPHNDWSGFKEVFRYSMAIMAIGIFSMTATKMRPIILSIYGNEGLGIVTDYRIMETITMFVISIGGMMVSIFLPKTSKLLIENNHEKVKDFAEKATGYTSVICLCLCIPLILNAKNILLIYVKEDYSQLASWLIAWLFIILTYLHNSPVSSLVLATGKTKTLVYSTAIACIISLTVNAILCQKFGVGAAIIGYGVYIAIQMSFYYLYFNTKVLGLDSFKIFLQFIKPTTIAVFALLICNIIPFESISYPLLRIVISSSIWVVLFGALLLIFGIFDWKNIQQIVLQQINKIRKGKS